MGLSHSGGQGSHMGIEKCMCAPLWDSLQWPRPPQALLLGSPQSSGQTEPFPQSDCGCDGETSGRVVRGGMGETQVVVGAQTRSGREDFLEQVASELRLK